MYPRRMEEAFRDPVVEAEWFYPPERNPHVRHILLALLGIVMWIFIFFLMLYR